MTIKSETWYWEKLWGDFRLGKANLRVEWDGGSADAVLYDEGVPRTVAALVEALPLTVPVVHVAWSGEMVMSSEAYQLGVDVHENRTRLVRPGDLSWDPEYGEIAVTYGSAECRMPTGPHAVVVLGQLVSGLAELAAWCRARRFEGLGELRLAR